MIDLLDLPVISEQEETAGPKFCHIVCKCTVKISLCGAYKEKLCYSRPTVSELGLVCSVCKKPVCKECLELLIYVCPRCGE